jgi:hypothetical protein
VNTCKCDRPADAQPAREATARAARGEFRLVDLFNHSPRPFVVVEARFGRRQSTGRAHQEFDAEPMLKLSTNFDTAGCPTLRRRAAAENDPVSTTTTNAAIAANRSILLPCRHAIPGRNKSYPSGTSTGG